MNAYVVVMVEAGGNHVLERVVGVAESRAQAALMAVDQFDWPSAFEVGTVEFLGEVEFGLGE